jgi:hypothetical protein
MFNFRNRHDDYCSVIAKAVRMLGHSTVDARQRVYERARSAVLAEASESAGDVILLYTGRWKRCAALSAWTRAHPPVDQSDILAAQMCLEAAIKEVEADALGNQRAQAVKGVSSTISSGAGVLGAPPSHQNGEQRRTPITRRWVRVFGRADGRGQFREEGLHLPSKMHSGKGRDPWLSELLARASREVDEDDQELRRLPR